LVPNLHKICRGIVAEALPCKSIAKDYLVFNDDVCGVKLEIEVMAQPDLDSVHLVMELFQRMQEREAVVVFRNLMEVVVHGREIVPPTPPPHREREREIEQPISSSAEDENEMETKLRSASWRPGPAAP
jgi:hypothetical protein